MLMEIHKKIEADSKIKREMRMKAENAKLMQSLRALVIDTLEKPDKFMG